MKISKKIAIFSLLLAVLLVNACSALTSSDEPANKTWWLMPYTGTTQQTAPDTLPLVDVSVSVIPGLDTNRILTLSGDAELNRYAAGRWADNLPELVESLVGRTLESSGRFEVVSKRSRAGSDDCDLQLEVREFFAELDSDGRTSGVRVAVSGRYQCGDAKPVPLSLSASVPVHEERMSVIVGAFQKALDSVLEDMLEKV